MISPQRYDVQKKDLIKKIVFFLRAFVSWWQILYFAKFFITTKNTELTKIVFVKSNLVFLSLCL